MQFYNFSHLIHLHVWDIPLYIVIILCVLFLIFHVIRMKKQKEQLEEELEKALLREKENEEGVTLS